jgi:hypothetical protein
LAGETHSESKEAARAQRTVGITKVLHVAIGETAFHSPGKRQTDAWNHKLGEKFLQRISQQEFSQPNSRLKWFSLKAEAGRWSRKA